MGLLLPLALALLALAIPIILFYMLRLRRAEQAVSSSLLWRQVLLDRTANAPGQRLRRNLLLLVQLVLLLLLVFALARPFFSAQPTLGGNVVIVLDASASMQAADESGGISRFEQAKREASSLVAGLSGGQRVTLVLAGPTPYVAASAQTDRSALQRVLDGLTASNSRGDVATALTLAASSAQQVGDPAASTVVLISDGTFSQEGSLPQMPTQTRYIGVGQSSRNLGITALSLREADKGPELFASVFNSGDAPATALLTVTVDGTLRDSREVSLAAGQESAITTGGLPLDTRVVHAGLSTADPGANLLAADDQAWVVRSQPASPHVLLVSEGNGFLEKALRLVPNVTLSRASPPDYSPPATSTLTVLDGWLPAQLPRGNLLLVAPPDSPLLPVSGTLQYPSIGQIDVNDPLMRFVDLSNTHLASAERVTAPQWARVLVRTTGGDALVLAGETQGRRVVALAFDLHQTDLPLQVAFPILVANLVEWLQPGAQAAGQASLSADEPFTMQLDPLADEVSVTSPGGQTSRVPVSGQRFSFAGTGELGIYSVQQMAKGKPLGEPRLFAVNLFSREESAIAPRHDVSLAGVAPRSGTEAPQREMEVWPWVVAAALLVLSLEWWLYNRTSGRGATGRPGLQDRLSRWRQAARRAR